MIASAHARTCLIAVAIAAGLTVAPLRAAEMRRVEIKDNWFHVDGERFFVKGVCYFEAHDVEGRYVQNSPEVLDYEFGKIKEAGFNTIRTFLTPEKIEIAAKHGLMIYQDATRLCFSDEYGNPARLQQHRNNVDEIVGFSKRYDNILFYSIDNEPNIHALYRQGEENAEAMWRMLAAKVKEVQPSAFTSIAMMPPTAFADVSMCDIVCLNLYPFCPAAGSIGYAAYADWYRRRYAAGKPFIISEYGWTDDLAVFGPTMTQLLDKQIRAGASGSFFFTWRSWHKEKTADSQWWGFVPNFGRPGDHTNQPRPIFHDFQRYFEAVVVEPKMDGLYAKKVPFEIYGTDKTKAVVVEINGQRTQLKKHGKYWWRGGVPFGPEWFGAKTASVEVQGKGGAVLVRKDVPIHLAARKRSLSVEIVKPQGPLKAGVAYEADVLVVDESGRRAPGQALVLGVVQSAKGEWESRALRGITGTNGVYHFSEQGLTAGYFTIMAGVDVSPGIETRADVDMRRVEE